MWVSRTLSRLIPSLEALSIPGGSQTLSLPIKTNARGLSLTAFGKPHGHMCGKHVMCASSRQFNFPSSTSILAFNLRSFSISSNLWMDRINRKELLQDKLKSIDVGTKGELNSLQIQELSALEERILESKEVPEEAGERKRVRPVDWMPRLEDYEKLYDNVKYKELPIIFIKAGKNNTKISMQDGRGRKKTMTTAGIEGFKRAKRGTNIAAQGSALNFAKRLVRTSKLKNIRVVVNGLGPGRVSAIEGLVMGGMNIVSISDNTPVFGLDHGDGPGPRPRKVRRV